MKHVLVQERSARLLGLVALAVCSSCSMVLDTEQKQCTKPEDCGTFEGKPTYACEENFCRRVSCREDADCAARGNFVCEDNYCHEALCLTNDECTEGTETCMAGRCVDPIFHCFDDVVPLTSEEPAVLKFNVIAYSNKKPMSELEVKVCAIADTACNTPLEVDVQYNKDNGDLEIRGLENGSRYSVRLYGKNNVGVEMLETEYYMQRPVIGLTQEADRFELVPPDAIKAIALMAGASWDETKGLVLAEVFGCDNRPLSGVSLTNSRAGTLFYLTGTANADATETDNLGQGGFVNMEVAQNGQPLLHTLTFSYGSQNLFSFPVTPRPGVLTFLNIYMSDYRTTTGRARQVER